MSNRAIFLYLLLWTPSQLFSQSNIPVIPDFNKAMVCHKQDQGTYNKLISTSHNAHTMFDFFRNQYTTLLQQQPTQSQNPRIPKIIHQIWIGPKPFPKKCKKWQKTWLKLHPDWEYKLWTNEDVKHLSLVNQKYFDAEKNWGAKSDILRYEILYQFGGLYIDVDFECLTPFDWIHHCCDFYASLLEISRLHNHARLANGIIACAAHHPLLAHLVEEIKNFRSKSNLLHRVGPDFFTQVIHKYITSCPGVNIIFPSNIFFSWSKNKLIVQPETIGIHYYAGTWH